jgi:hypothetical protein
LRRVGPGTGGFLPFCAVCVISGFAGHGAGI